LPVSKKPHKRLFSRGFFRAAPARKTRAKTKEKELPFPPAAGYYFCMMKSLHRLSRPLGLTAQISVVDAVNLTLRAGIMVQIL
jgi:hypothetical protein